MANTLRISATSSLERLITHLRAPLYRNGYALVINSAITAGLGVVFWALAARSYSTETVGLNSAAISTMISLSFLSQLNMTNAMNRFLPTAGQMTSRMILIAYAICAALAFVVSGIFILGLELWTPALSILKESPWISIGFVASTVIWTIFAIQDGILVGLRQATWIPVENTIFALAKLGLLVPLVAFFPEHGVYIAWTIPTLFLVVPANLFIFWYLVPRHIKSTQAIAVPLMPTQIVRYVTGDYLSSLIGLIVTSLLPLVIISLLSPEANAYFALAWTVSYALYLVSQNMGMSLIAEAVTDPASLPHYVRQTLTQAARLVIPVVLVTVVIAPYFLRFFGEDYVLGGTAVLRLLCLSAIPFIVNSIYISLARVNRRIGTVMLLQASIHVPALGLSYFLLEQYGITGVGYAWLIAQGVVAIILSTGLFQAFGCPTLATFFLEESR